MTKKVKLSNIRAAVSTSFEPKDSDGQPLGIIIEGHTFATKEWKAARSEYSIDDAVYLNQGNKMKLGAPLEDNEIKGVASLVTDIKNLDDWSFSKENVFELFLNPEYASIPQQWHIHLKQLGNGLKVQKKKPAENQSST